MSENTKSLFDDLGRPTMRGVRKCFKCGTLNGTRGVACKNKACRQIFQLPKVKNADPKIDSVKLLCGSDLQIYSAKFMDDGYLRCFVHLPTIEGIEDLKDILEIKVIKQSTATCYACREVIEDIGTISLNLNPCVHADYVLSCLLEAEPLDVKREIVEIFPFSEEIRQEIITMMSENEGSMVQRITKNTLVVRCAPEAKHPLGLLHVSIFQPAKANLKNTKIMCDCHIEHTKPFILKENLMCLHFFLCMCAFASDVKLLDEFRTVIQFVLKTKSSDIFASCTKDSDPDIILRILYEFFSYDTDIPVKKRKVDNQSINTQDTEEVNLNRVMKKEKSDISSTKQSPTVKAVTMTSMDFDQWLASVTERINQTMHYQFNGFPEPLLFHVPQTFFDLLQQKISDGTKKKRLPNRIVAFTRKTSLPVGSFSKYIWHITNVLHVKRIFDTKLVQLELTRSFIENRDGTYTLYNPLEDETAKLAVNYRKTAKNSLIKPLELKTFLKVGNTAPNQKVPTPFIIEWIPDVLPITHVGELRIRFQYGHQRNGIIESGGKDKLSVITQCI